MLGIIILCMILLVIILAPTVALFFSGTRAEDRYFDSVSESMKMGKE